MIYLKQGIKSFQTIFLVGILFIFAFLVTVPFANSLDILNTNVQDDTITFNPYENAVSASEITSRPNSIASVVDLLNIPADGEAIQTNVSLALDTLYTIRVTGMFVWGGCDPTFCPNGGPEYLRWGDVGYVTDEHFHSQYQVSYVYLEIDGAKPTFSQYSPNHAYVSQVIGNGQPMNFRLHDCDNCFEDNAGAIRVEIIQGEDNGAIILGPKPFQQRNMPAGDNPFGGGDWEDEPYGNPDYTSTSADCGINILHCGCRLTTWAMTLDHYGQQYEFHTTPKVLNDWLRAEDGYFGLFINPRKVLEYARNETPLGTLVYGRSVRDDQKLHDLLVASIPVDLRVYSSYGEHHVLAVGETNSVQGLTTWYINDPSFNSVFNPRPTLNVGYNNSYDLMQWVDELTSPVQLASTTILLASPAELLIVDPLGRRTGVQPISGNMYDEIPEAFYYSEALADNNGGNGAVAYHAYKVFDLPKPVNGEYIIQVIGTNSGSYNLQVTNYDDIGVASSATVSGEIEKGSTDFYKMTYTSDPGSPVVIQPIELSFHTFLPIVYRN